MPPCQVRECSLVTAVHRGENNQHMGSVGFQLHLIPMSEEWPPQASNPHSSVVTPHPS